MSTIKYCILILILSGSNAYSQDGIFINQSGSELLESLVTTYKPEIALSYGDTRDSMYLNVYRDEEGFVECFYTGHKIFLPLDVDPSAYLYNDEDPEWITAEHIYPQSKGAGEGAARSDMHHLVPCIWQANRARSNYPFAEIDDQDTDEWFASTDIENAIPTNGIDDYSELLNGGFGNIGRWEPRESVKGDVARAVFYFYTMYKEEADERDDDYFEGMKEVLLEWHYLDPVDSIEHVRNELKAVYQGGELNPFILDCTLVGRAYFGIEEDSCNEVSSTTNNLSRFSKIKMYPNPVRDTLRIDIESVDKIKEVRIYNIQGKLVIKQEIEFESNVIDVSNLEAGTYEVVAGAFTGKMVKL